MLAPMQSIIIKPDGSPELPEPSGHFSILMLYEDFSTGKRAKSTYDYLVEHLGQDCEFRNNMWKFDVLRLPKLKEMAAREAGEADMVIISLHGNDPLPAEIKSWCDLWLELKGDRPAALVALFDQTGITADDPGSPCGYLREVARRGRLDYFVQTSGPAEEIHQLEKSPQPSGMQASVLHQIEATPRWEFAE
jgi:hypothetical protein